MPQLTQRRVNVDLFEECKRLRRQIEKLEKAICFHYLNRTAEDYMDFNNDEEAVDYFLHTNHE